MRRVMWWVGLTVLVLLVATLGLFTVSKLMGPTEEQRAALALLDADDPKPEGRNAFSALWLIEYDVPEAEREALVRVDAERYRQALLRLGADEPLPEFSTAADRGFERASDLSAGPSLCGARGVDCLHVVRAQHEGFSRRIEQEKGLLERMRALAAYDHYRNLMPPDYRMPVPRMQWVSILRTASALDFIEGRTDKALTDLCEDTYTWRRLGANSDSLIVSMIGVSVVDAHARLFANMLAELPLGHPLPPACGKAFDPQQVAPDICQALRGEAAWALRIMDSPGFGARSSTEHLLRLILLDSEATSAIAAPTYAHACTEGVRRALVDDTPIPPLPTLQSPWRLECASNAMGCLVVNAGAPAYMPYLKRPQDTQAILRTVDKFLHLREQAAASGRTMVQVVRDDDMRPAVSTWRTPMFDESTGEISIPLRGHGDRIEWCIPLPASRLEESDW